MSIRLYTRRNQVLLDVAICGTAWCVAYGMRYGTPMPAAASQQMMLLLSLAAVPILVSASLGTYKCSWRYVNAQDALSIARAYGRYAGALLAVALLVGPHVALLHIPASIIVSMCLLSTVGAIGARLARRVLYEYERRFSPITADGPRRFVIIGAGLHGVMVAKEMLLRKGIEVVGFLDDDPTKQGLTIASVPVLGRVADLPQIAKTSEVDEVLVCISPQSRRSLHLETVTTTQGTPLRSRIMPTLEELLESDNVIAVLPSATGNSNGNGNGNGDGNGNLAQALKAHGGRNGNTGRVDPLMGGNGAGSALKHMQSANRFRALSSLEAAERSSGLPVRNKSILITGGAGFIGSSLAEELVEHNRIILFDQSFAHSPVQYTSLLQHPNVTRVEGNILTADLGNLLKQANVVIHAAAMLGVNRVCNSARETLETNYVGTSRLLRALDCSREIERFIYFSTSEVFGVNSFRVDEESQPHIGPIAESRWSYAMSKLAGEHLVASYFRETRLPIAIVRPFNIFGPRRTGDYALRRFILRALENEPLEVYGDGTQIRSWCYIEDFCTALVQMIARPEAVGEDFNIGSPANIATVHELARKVIELTGSRSSMIFRESPYPDISIRVPSLDKAKRLLGYEPKFDLDTGLRLTIQWHRERLDLLRPPASGVMVAAPPVRAERVIA